MTSTSASNARVTGNGKVWSLVVGTLEGSAEVFIAASVCEEVAGLVLSSTETGKSGVELVAAVAAVSPIVIGVGDGATLPASSAAEVSGESFFLRELRREVLPVLELSDSLARTVEPSLFDVRLSRLRP